MNISMILASLQSLLYYSNKKKIATVILTWLPSLLDVV